MFTRLLTITTLLLLVVALPVSATPNCQHRGNGPEWTDDRQDHRRQPRQQLRKQLDLTPEQAQQLRSLMRERRTQMAPLREQCHSERAALRQSYHDRISALLTPAQRDQWTKLRDRGEQRRKQRGHDVRQNF